MGFNPARTDLENNPDFWADIQNPDMSRRQITEKWNCSNGYVDKKRGKGKKGEKTAPGDSSEISTGPNGKTFNFIRHRPVTLEDARELIRSTGDNPDGYNISIKTIAYGGDKSSNKISAWPKTGMALAETYPLAELYKEVNRNRHTFTPPVSIPGRAVIVNVADMQLGKRARRGATPETLARLAEKRELLDALLAERRPERVLIADLGDGLEGFESGGNPMFTNDLSLPDQLDCYATEMYKFVALAARYAPVEVAVVPSNHAAWRRAKQTLGNPSDDFGIFVHKQVQKVAEAAGLDASWHYPLEYDESVRVDMLGVPLGFVHGNQFGPGKAVDYWQSLAFGGHAVTPCDVMVHGHYHSFTAGVAGTNPATGRERIAIGCPTLDNGSDWFRNIAGRDSEPGLLVFDVTESGFDLGSLKIL